MDDNSHGHILTLQARRQVESHAGELVATLGSVIIVIIMVPGFFSGSKPKDYLDHPWWWAGGPESIPRGGRRPTNRRGSLGPAEPMRLDCSIRGARAGCRHRHEKRRHPRDAGPTGGGQ